ncbi:MAG: LPS export ABC transporter ATP-binding protein [Acidobacteriota bacterium]
MDHPRHELIAKSLVKAYGHRTVVRGVDLAFPSGRVVGLLGPNGAGKTTTFYMLVGLVAPTSGDVLLDGRSIVALPMHERARAGIAYLPQEPSIFRRMTVEENLKTVLQYTKMSRGEQEDRMEAALTELNIRAIAKSPAFSLSGGERRRVEVARALVLSPRFFLLDEPFAGIDPMAVEDIQALILTLREKGIGVVITDHNVRETLKITDEAYIIHDGRILAEGTPAQLAADAGARRVFLGESFTMR